RDPRARVREPRRIGRDSIRGRPVGARPRRGRAAPPPRARGRGEGPRRERVEPAHLAPREGGPPPGGAPPGQAQPPGRLEPARGAARGRPRAHRELSGLGVPRRLRRLAARQLAPRGRAPRRGEEPMKRPRILAVEDEAIVALDLRDRLEGLRYEVTAVVATGE